MDNNSSFSEALNLYLKASNWGKAEKLCEERIKKEPQDPYAHIGLLLVSKKFTDIEDLKKITRLAEKENFMLAYKYADDALREKLSGLVDEVDRKEVNIDSINKKLEQKAKETAERKPLVIKTYHIVTVFIVFAVISFLAILYMTDAKYFSKLFTKKSKATLVKKLDTTKRTISHKVIPESDEELFDNKNVKVVKNMKVGKGVKVLNVKPIRKVDIIKDERIEKEIARMLENDKGKVPYIITPNATAEKIIAECMVKCPAGDFMMGSPDTEPGRSKKENLRKVTISEDFYIGKYEVTQAQFKAVMDKNPSRFVGDNNPVENVSWSDIMEFLNRLNNMTGSTRPAGYRFDLPTEEQWEYACRAGTTTAYNNGRSITDKLGNCPNLDEIAWYISNSRGKTHPVGQKKPNAWGIYDMLGNVKELCIGEETLNVSAVSTATSPSDIPFAPNIRQDITDNASAPQTVYYSMICGGCYFDSPLYCRSAEHKKNLYYAPERRFGFRFALVKTPKREVKLIPVFNKKDKVKK